VAATADETLADEARRRKAAGATAISAGILTIVSGAVAAIVYSDKPTVPVLDALRERLQAGSPSPGLKVRQALFYDERAVQIVLVSALLALAALLMGLALAHLYRSTKARRKETPRAALVAAIAGGVLVAVAELALAVGIVVEVRALADASQPTAEAAREALAPPVAQAAVILRQLGVFALGVAFIVVALNAMRVGLLTRFMGVLGIIVGVLFIFPLGASLPILQAFWLVAIGALFLGAWPAGMPPAWAAGEARPWPSQQELREERLRRKGEGGEQPPARRRAEPPETPAPAVPERPAHPSSKKRKRKRR
jgi:hypothetical protein